MTTRVELRSLAVAALTTANTLAGLNVRPVSIAPQMTSNGREFPVLFAAVPTERKASLGNAGPPKFTASMDLVVVARAAANMINTDDMTALADIDLLIEQVELAILGNYDLLLVVQEFASVETHVVLASTGGTPIGEATIRFQCELFQEFAPQTGDPLTEIIVQVPVGDVQPLKLDVHLPQ